MKQSKSKKSRPSSGVRTKSKAKSGAKSKSRPKSATKTAVHKNNLKLSVIGIVSFSILGVALVISALVYNKLSTSEITLEVSTDIESVVVGFPHDVGFTISNDSDTFLTDASLSLRLPESVVFASGDNRRISVIDIGDISPGEIMEERFSVILLPDESDIRELDAILSYSFGAITARFEKRETISIETVDFPLDLEFVSPEEILSGQDFEVDIKYENVFSRILPVFRIVFNRPDTFSIESTSPELENNSYWPIDSLPVSGSGELSVVGSVDLPGGSEFDLGVSVILDLGGISYEVLHDSVEIKVVKSPLSIDISTLGDRSSHELSESLDYLITYQNNTDELMENARVDVSLFGEMFDFQSLSAENGIVDLEDGTIVWAPNNIPELERIPPGGSGTLSFTVDISDSYNIRRINDRNYTVRADVRIESNGIRGVNSIESRISGNIEVEALGYYRDAESMILNEGPFPPIVNTSTEYTIHWRLTNFATDVSDIVVRAPLADGVVFTGDVRGDNISVEGNEVVWNLPRISATTGIISTKPRVVFQVRATPDNSMRGEYMDLLGETTVTANDEFTGLQIISYADKVTTRLEADSTVGEEDGRVR